VVTGISIKRHDDSLTPRDCNAAGVKWRGRPDYEWDHIPHVAFAIGYTAAESIQFADTAMRIVKDVFGHYPKSIASWNLDAITRF